MKGILFQHFIVLVSHDTYCRDPPDVFRSLAVLLLSKATGIPISTSGVPLKVPLGSGTRHVGHTNLDVMYKKVHTNAR